MLKKFYWCFLLLIVPFVLDAQKNVTTAGFQFKPIFPSNFFSTGPVSKIEQNIKITWEQSSGFCFGMVIRHGFTDRLSVESGINFVNRHYDLTIDDIDSTMYSSKSKFRYIGYEIPVSLLVYIQLSEKIFMNVSMGQSFDAYPSDIITTGDYFIHRGYRPAWVNIAFIANLGFEFRTEKSGYFYLGSSFHRPYTYNILSEVGQYHTGISPVVELHNKLSGNYLTVDLRYFFHQDPEKKKKKKKN